MGLLATAAVADMPVGAPFSLRPCSGAVLQMACGQARHGLAHRDITVEESRSRLPASATNREGVSNQSV